MAHDFHISFCPENLLGQKMPAIRFVKKKKKELSMLRDRLRCRPVRIASRGRAWRAGESTTILLDT